MGVAPWAPLVHQVTLLAKVGAPTEVFIIMTFFTVDRIAIGNRVLLQFEFNTEGVGKFQPRVCFETLRV